MGNPTSAVWDEDNTLTGEGKGEGTHDDDPPGYECAQVGYAVRLCAPAEQAERRAEQDGEMSALRQTHTALARRANAREVEGGSPAQA